MFWQLSYFQNSLKKQISGNTGRTGRSAQLCWEPYYTRTHSYLPGIKMKTNQREVLRGLLMNKYFVPFHKIIVSFFSFFYQDVNKTRSNCAIIGCNLSKKHKLTLYKTQNGFFTRSYLPAQNLGDRHPNTIELASCLVHVLCDFKAAWHQEAPFSRSISCWCLYFTFLIKVLPPPFHYSLGSYLYLFFVIHFTKSKLIARSVPVLKWPEKMHYFLF